MVIQLTFAHTLNPKCNEDSLYLSERGGEQDNSRDVLPPISLTGHVVVVGSSEVGEVALNHPRNQRLEVLWYVLSFSHCSYTFDEVTGLFSLLDGFQEIYKCQKNLGINHLSGSSMVGKSRKLLKEGMKVTLEDRRLQRRLMHFKPKAFCLAKF